MLTFNFQVNPRLLAYSFITNTAPTRFVDSVCDPEIVKFQNAAWYKNKEANDFIRFGPKENMFVTDNSLEKLAKDSDELLEAMIADSTFAPLLSQTAETLPIVRDEWERNCAKTSEWVAGMTGLDFSKDVPVYLTHPKIKQGHAGRECIFWAHRAAWPNYNTVYLWHEYLHLAIPGGDLEHAVIQLITDNELKVRLNGGSYPPFEGHEYLFKLMQLLLPEWQQYLKGTENRNIENFIAKSVSQRSIKEELIACEKHRHHASEK